MSRVLINLALSISCGYLTVILSYLVLAFVMTSAMPKFVMQKGHYTSSYLLIHPFLWAICGFGGGYVATVLASSYPYLSAGILALLVAYVVLANSGQMARSKVLQAALATGGIAGGTALCMAL